MVPLVQLLSHQSKYVCYRGLSVRTGIGFIVCFRGFYSET